MYVFLWALGLVFQVHFRFDLLKFHHWCSRRRENNDLQLQLRAEITSPRRGSKIVVNHRWGGGRERGTRSTAVLLSRSGHKSVTFNNNNQGITLVNDFGSHFTPGDDVVRWCVGRNGIRFVLNGLYEWEWSSVEWLISFSIVVYLLNRPVFDIPNTYRGC